MFFYSDQVLYSFHLLRAAGYPIFFSHCRHSKPLYVPQEYPSNSGRHVTTVCSSYTNGDKRSLNPYNRIIYEIISKKGFKKEIEEAFSFSLSPSTTVSFFLSFFCARMITGVLFFSFFLSFPFRPLFKGLVTMKLKLLSFSYSFISVWHHSPSRYFFSLFPFSISIPLLRSSLAFFLSFSISCLLSLFHPDVATFRIRRSLFSKIQRFFCVPRACLRSSVRGSMKDFSFYFLHNQRNILRS
ncbi:unnamed protein product [Acanthosepion pharaonis]|uniref:Uncharacterized protein n=1 Tax=Acanthosepion pharaonis TaxID=158019 RepID=A0A812BHB5_ACAPH|nr:unnamed protein product [Sepia pharaonis]